MNSVSPYTLESQTELDRKQRGAFYTSSQLAQSLTEETLKTWYLQTKTPPATALDPACGEGVFLVALFRAIFKTTQDALGSLRTLWGIDIDPQAVALTRAALLHEVQNVARHSLEAAGKVLEQQICLADALLEFPAHAPASFDVIIGNPPFGLSRTATISKRDLAALKIRFKRYVSGKMNAYTLFIALSWERLGTQGIACLITPNSWLGITSARALRAELLDQHGIVSIHSIPREEFSELGVEVIATQFARSGSRAAITLRASTNETKLIPYAFCIQSPERQIPFGLNTQDIARAATLRQRCISLSELSEYFIPGIALQVYRTGAGTPTQTAIVGQQSAFHSRQPGIDTIPYLEGRDIGRGTVTWSGSYLSYGPWMAECPPRDRFQGPRVVIREVLGSAPHRIRAAYIDFEAAYNRSILHVLPGPKGSAQLLKALTTLLNSKTGSWLLTCLGRKSQRTLFPKLVLADLKDFLLPVQWIEHSEMLANGADDDTINALY